MTLMRALPLLAAAGLLCSCLSGAVAVAGVAAGTVARDVAAYVDDDMSRDEYSRGVAAELEMNRFHVRWAQGDYRAIYGNADATFRAGTKLDSLEASLEIAAARIGALDRTRVVKHSGQWRGDDLYLTFVTESDCDAGVASETFVWRVTASNTVYLVRYVLEAGGVRLYGGVALAFVA